MFNNLFVHGFRNIKGKKQYKVTEKGNVDWGKIFRKKHPHTLEKARRVRQMQSGYLPMVS